MERLMTAIGFFSGSLIAASAGKALNNGHFGLFVVLGVLSIFNFYLATVKIRIERSAKDDK